jgi:2-oxoglutarate dehydrogenase E2 component (dihydrolipoamide succinyltransferase)
VTKLSQWIELENIADAMVNSKKTSPHVTSFIESDVTNVVKWRAKHKDAFEKREGKNLLLCQFS